MRGDDDEVEDIVGDVQYTDSQKSVTTSAVYSKDFTDSSPERHNSSGKQTYVLDRDSDDSESTFRLHRDQRLINLNEVMLPKTDMQQMLYDEINKSIRANFRPERTILTHDYTQTSKTIIELAQTEIVVKKSMQTKSLETQTSFQCLTEYKTVVKEYNNKNEVAHNVIKDMDDIKKLFLQQHPNVNDNVTLIQKSGQNNNDEQSVTEENSLSVYEESEIKNETITYSNHSSEDRIIPFIDDESKNDEDQNNIHEESECDSLKYESDIEEDSLMLENEHADNRERGDNASDTSETKTSVDNDVHELYSKLSESPLLFSSDVTIEPCALKLGTLTPLTEETSQRKSCLDITNSSQTLMEPYIDKNETLFVKNDEEVKILTNNEVIREYENFKLPPIPNKTYPNSPHINFLFSVKTNPIPSVKTERLPNLFEDRNDIYEHRWEVEAKKLGSGESPFTNGRSGMYHIKTPRDSFYLPPIQMEGVIYHNTTTSSVSPEQNSSPPENNDDAISIRSRIKELKTMTSNKTRSSGHVAIYDFLCSLLNIILKYRSRMEKRNCSPKSNSSRQERLCDIVERGCDSLCTELIRRLRSSSWLEVVETMEDIPRALEKYWTVLTVTRTADILRQVMVHIDSPRTQVARSACTALAEILKNTNYTRKPDFYEGMSMLLTKTGSFSRPVRRAANVALDAIACRVDVAHTASAICVFGVEHKSALVRCASARVLVVCCALAEGGRQILRARPPTAATARTHVLRALALLLQDKNVDTRKYALRLYALLRPLPTFEAYFLTDVDAELAVRHMKKYDAVLARHKRDSVTSLSIFS
ncbi:uncharacterized protein LOC112047897 [Bicyclus anynana]|uniref:Uncharacterized protein LOC112047897 n=1 Tax=Bicyclus anynana TaxID=110368 RepID=A0ABM3LLL1_BICAN|nr:uncharacterized protein LOC112047897 [Bicyclus anynana]